MDIRPATEQSREVPLAERDLPIKDVETQDDHPPIRRRGFVKPMDKALYSSTRTGSELRWGRFIVNPAMGRKTDHGLMSKQTTGTRGTVDNVHISPRPFTAVSVSSTNVIIREIGLHVVDRHGGNFEVLSFPSTYLNGRLGQGHGWRNRRWIIQPGGPRAVAETCCHQQDHGKNPRYPDRRASASPTTVGDRSRPIACDIRSFGVHLLRIPQKWYGTLFG